MSRLWLIAGREYSSYVRTPGFWISLILPPIIIAAAALIPAQMDRASPPPVLAVVDLGHEGLDAAVARAAPGRKNAGGQPVAWVTPAPPRLARAIDKASAGEAARRLVDQGALDEAAIIHRDGGRVGVDLWSRSGEDQPVAAMIDEAVSRALREQALQGAGVPPQALRRAEALRPDIANFAPRAAAGRVSRRDQLPGWLGFGFAFLLWSAVTSGAGMLLNSVVEERGNRILEVLASSADTLDILGGKIAGAAGLTATVLGLWLGAGALIVRLTDPQLAADMAYVLIGQGLGAYFAVFFIGGYLIYASLFASIGAFCDTPREAQTLLGPMMLLLMIPLLCLSGALKRPDSPALHALAWFPPFTPFLMPALVGGPTPAIELIGGAVMVLATAALALALASRAFRAGIVAAARPSLPALIGRLRKRA